MLFGFSTSTVSRDSVPFWESFWIRVVISLVIYSGLFVSSQHLLSPRARMSWIDVNFYNQNPCMPSWPGIFQFCTFLNFALSDSRSMSTSGSSLSSCYFFPYYLSIQPSYTFSILIFYTKIDLLPLHPVFGISSSILLLFVDRIFFISLESLVLLDSVMLSFRSFFFHQYLLSYLFKLHCQIYQLFWFGSFHLNVYLCFSLSLASSFVVAIPLPVLLA